MPKTRLLHLLYALLESNGDRSQAAAMLAQSAAQLRREVEVSEALMLYRALIAHFSDTRPGRGAYLTIAAIERKEGEAKGAIREYRELVRKFPRSKEAELVAFELVRMGASQKEVFK